MRHDYNKIVKNDLKATATAFAGIAPLTFLGGVYGLIVFPWLAGREAGIGAYKIEKNDEGYRYMGPFYKNSFEGHSLKGSLKNAWNEVKGVTKSFVPLALSIPAISILSGSENEVTNTLAYTALAAHVIGGYLISRTHSKNILAPHYAKGFEDQWHANNPNQPPKQKLEI
jgi:hypothetical protein